MSYVAGSYSYKSNKPKKHYLKFLVPLLILIGLLAGWWFFIRSSDNGQDSVEPEVTQVAEPEVEEEPEELFPDLQPFVDNWVTTHTGTYSILITDKDGGILAQSNPNEVFFAASLYKLSVAYEMYRKIDAGVYNPGAIYLNGKTRGQCLDAMIRSSDNPCGETMLVELGLQYTTDKMIEYGLKNTNLARVQTTASDASLILQKVYAGTGLTASSRAAFLDSMKTQDDYYRRGLPSGIANAVVYNKVGWNVDQEWHDAAILELPDGRVVIVAVLTTDAGFQEVAAFGQELEKALE